MICLETFPYQHAHVYQNVRFYILPFWSYIQTITFQTFQS